MTPRLRSGHGARRAARHLVAMGVLLAALAGATPALAAPVPHWALEAHSAPTNLQPGGHAEIVATASNWGDAEINGEKEEVTITDTLPEGLEVTKLGEFSTGSIEGGVSEKGCSKPSPRTVSCTFTRKLEPYEEVGMIVIVKVSASLAAPAEIPNKLTVSGGGLAEPEPLERPLKVSDAPTEFGVERYELTPENEDGSPDTQAGSHPFQLTTTFNLNEAAEYSPVHNTIGPFSPALQRNLSFQLPPGLIGDANVLGNPNAVKQCSGTLFGQLAGGAFRDSCPGDTAVGVAAVTISEPTNPAYGTFLVPVFNLVPAPGEPARLGFDVAKVPVILDTALRSGGDYGVTVNIENTPETVNLLSSRVTIWGTPTDSSHNQSRGWACLPGNSGPGVCEPGFEVPDPAPFLTLPTSCTGQPTTSVSGESWPSEGTGKVHMFGAGTENEENTTYRFPTELTGCERLGFTTEAMKPTISVEPETEQANTPTGLKINAHVPQAEPEGLAEAAVKDTTVEFPEGLLLNPSAANGLESCPEGETGIGFTGSRQLDEELEPTNTFTEKLPEPLEPGRNFCANASKVGVVHIKTPDLPNELEGGVYLAAQNENPFGSLFAMYIVAQDPVSKVLVKAAGEVYVNPQTGRITSTFKNTPDAPFEELKLELFGGPRASLSTPPSCGAYETKASLTPWSGSQAEPGTVTDSSSFNITSGPGGTACPNPQPFAPSFTAGSTNTQGGGFTPFTLTIGVPQADSALKAISSMQLPPGLAAVLASVTPCAEPWAAEGTCGEHDPESEIGQSASSSGLGSEPYTLPGKVYLTGPYDGAPFGLSAVTYADAGPFHLGKVVVRSSIAVNAYTAAATINTEAARFIKEDGDENGQVTEFSGLPEFIDGVPSQIKQLTVTVDRAGFEFNPTNCSPMSITATLKGAGGGEEGVSSPFQASNCGSLPFAPKLTASVVGQGSKEGGTTFSVKIESPGLGQANIHKADLTIPASLPSRLTTIQKACLEKVFNANPASCDEGSVIGEGIVHTPVFKNALTGPAYLVSHGNAAFPDVEFVLQGEGVTVILDGKTDIKHSITYSKFETSPDAPFTSFETVFPAGPHSALTPAVPEDEYFNLCKTSLSVPTELTGQNGAFISETTPVTITGCSGVNGHKEFKVAIKKHSVKGSTLTLVVVVPISGRLSVSGSGLRTLKRSFSKAGTYKLTLQLGPKARAAVAHKRRLNVHVHVGFTPTTGIGIPSAVSVKFP